MRARRKHQRRISPLPRCRFARHLWLHRAGSSFARAFPTLWTRNSIRDRLSRTPPRPPPRLGPSLGRRNSSRHTLVSSRHRLAHRARPPVARTSRGSRSRKTHATRANPISKPFSNSPPAAADRGHSCAAISRRTPARRTRSTHAEGGSYVPNKTDRFIDGHLVLYRVCRNPCPCGLSH